MAQQKNERYSTATRSTEDARELISRLRNSHFVSSVDIALLKPLFACPLIPGDCGRSMFKHAVHCWCTELQRSPWEAKGCQPLPSSPLLDVPDEVANRKALQQSIRPGRLDLQGYLPFMQGSCDSPEANTMQPLWVTQRPSSPWLSFGCLVCLQSKVPDSLLLQLIEHREPRMPSRGR